MIIRLYSKIKMNFLCWEDFCEVSNSAKLTDMLTYIMMNGDNKSPVSCIFMDIYVYLSI